MKQLSIRLEDTIAKMVSEIDKRPSTAIQEVVEVFVYLRKATLRELKGLFTKEEIIALADSFNGLIPTWGIMCNAGVLLAHTEDAEQFQYSASSNSADPAKLFAKIKNLTSAQAAILQLELIMFWREESPDLNDLVKRLT
jgi:hypothetical protein